MLGQWPLKDDSEPSELAERAGLGQVGQLHLQEALCAYGLATAQGAVQASWIILKQATSSKRGGKPRGNGGEGVCWRVAHAVCVCAWYIKANGALFFILASLVLRALEPRSDLMANHHVSN